MPSQAQEISSSRRKIAGVAKRNFWLLVANGSLAAASSALYSPAHILPVLVLKLTGSNFWAGLPLALINLGWLLPQTFAAHINRHLTHQKRAYLLPAVVRSCSWVVAAATLVFFPDAPPSVLCAVVMGMFAVHSFSCGMLGPAFFEVSTKAVRPDGRGKLFGYRQTIGNVAAAGVSVSLVAWLLAEPRGLRFPVNYGVLFSFAVIGSILVATTFMLVKESRQNPRPTAHSFGDHIREGFALFREDADFKRYIILRVVLMLSLTAVGRYTVFAVAVLGLPVQFVGVFMGISAAALAVTSLLWGHISDRRGRKVLLVASAVSAVATPLVALGAKASSPAVLFTVASMDFTGQVLLLCLAFAVIGSSTASLQIGIITILMDIAPRHKRASYYGFTNTFLAPLCFAFPAAGWVINALGYTGYFLVCSGLGAAALWLSVRMKQVRPTS